MRNWASSLALCVLAGAAAATPPRAVDVSDRLFGTSDDTLLILREFTDNHGMHAVRETATILVLRDLETGEDVGFRPVDRIIDRGPDADPRVLTFDLPSRVNPYLLRSESGFWPLDDPVYPAASSVGASGLRLTAEDGTDYRLPLQALVDQMAQSLAASRGILPRTGQGADPFDPRAFDPVAECVATSGTTLGVRRPALVRLACVDGATGQTARLWIVVPAAI